MEPRSILAVWGAFSALQIAISAIWGFCRNRTCQRVFTEGTAERKVFQEGYQRSFIGTVIFNVWIMLPVGGYLQLGHLLYIVTTNIDRWTEIAEPFMFVLFLSHLVLISFITWWDQIQLFFHQPCRLEGASSILLTSQAIHKNAEQEDAKKPMLRNSAPGGDSEEKPNEIDDMEGVGQSKDNVCWFIPVQYSVSEKVAVRFIEHHCIRYFWDGYRFAVPTVVQMNPKIIRDRLVAGMDQEQVESASFIFGKNEIKVIVPSVLECLIAEFCFSPTSCAQYIAFWMFFYTQNWACTGPLAVLFVASSMFKSLWIVRRTQAKLRDMAVSESEVTVLRGTWQRISSVDLLPGDVVRFEANMAVPCDIRLVSGAVVVNESMLTGEPMPIQKFQSDEEVYTEKRSLVYGGTQTLRCSGDEGLGAVGIVQATGGMSYKGGLIRQVLMPSPKFRLEHDVGKLVIIATVWAGTVGFPLIFVDVGSWVWNVIMTTTLVMQTLCPHLPVATIIGQSVATSRLRKDEIICSVPQRIPVAGKLHCMVFDKTGTITKDGVDLSLICPSKDGAFEEAKPYHQSDQTMDPKLSMMLGTCHTVTQFNDEFIGPPVEVAMLKACGWKLEDGKPVPPSGPDVIIRRQLEFDHFRMTSGVVVETEGELYVFVKGSYEKISDKCVGLPGDYVSVTEAFAKQQYYVLSAGVKRLPIDTDVDAMSRDELEADVNLMALLLFRNEIKPDSALAIDKLKEGSIRCVICTGDNALTAVSVGREVGILSKSGGSLGDFIDGKIVWTDLDSERRLPVPVGDLVLTAKAFQKIENIRDLMPRVKVLARMKPDDKVRSIELLQSHQWVVGMTGDGCNDTGALRAADFGMALSEEAGLVAPFSTADKSLTVLAKTVAMGRCCLSTNLATIYWFLVYGFCFSISKVMLTLCKNQFIGEWQRLFFESFFCILVTMAMTLSKPRSKLQPCRPTQHLFGWRSILSIAAPFTVWLIALGVCYMALVERPYYETFTIQEIGLPVYNWFAKSDAYFAEVLFLLLSAQLATVGLMFSCGAEHRRNVFRNWQIVLLFVGIMIFLFYLLLGEPSDLHCIFRVQCDNDKALKVDSWIVRTISSVGGCFFGPQISRWANNPGYSMPRPDLYRCFMDAPDYERITFEAPDDIPDWVPFATPQCNGPNNCLCGWMKFVVLVAMITMCLVTMLILRLVQRIHPKQKRIH